MKKTIENINETKSWFFENFKINKPLAKLSRKKGKGLKSIKLEMKNEGSSRHGAVINKSD